MTLKKKSGRKRRRKTTTRNHQDEAPHFYDGNRGRSDEAQELYIEKR